MSSSLRAVCICCLNARLRSSTAFLATSALLAISFSLFAGSTLALTAIASSASATISSAVALSTPADFNLMNAAFCALTCVIVSFCAILKSPRVCSLNASAKFFPA